jgi:hypothetical protein
MNRTSAILIVAALGCVIAADALAQVFAQAPPATPAPAAQPRPVGPAPVGQPPQAGLIRVGAPGAGGGTVFLGGQQGGFGGGGFGGDFGGGYVGWASGQPDEEMQKLMQSENELSHESNELMGKYTSIDDETERNQLKTSLREVLGKQFDAQRQRRELELKRVEERLSKLREQLNKRNNARETIVNRRLEQLISEADGLGWGAPGTGNIQYGLGGIAPSPRPARAR